MPSSVLDPGLRGTTSRHGAPIPVGGTDGNEASDRKLTLFLPNSDEYITGESWPPHDALKNGNMPVGDFETREARWSYSKSRIQAVTELVFSDCIKGQEEPENGSEQPLGAKTQRLSGMVAGAGA